MGKKTALFDCHLANGAKMVDFAGWDMPLHYGSQIKEHHFVRDDAGVFDVSHMNVIDLKGSKVQPFLRYLLANNIDKLKNNKGLYTCLLNHQGGILDDLIVYKIDDNNYRIVANSATREKDLAWIKSEAKNFAIEITERNDLAMLALQGPTIREKIPLIFPKQAQSIIALTPFTLFIQEEWFIACTGYTGEDGYEIILPAREAKEFWDKLIKIGIHPCGLGARDTLRLEAGLNLYGTDMDETVTPYESNLSWTVALDPKDRDFIGRSALEKQLQLGVKKRLVGLELEESGVLRNHQKVIVEGLEEGEITSGSFSVSLNKGIAFARVPADFGETCQVEMRNGRMASARVIKPPFVRKSKKTFSEKNGAVT